MPTVITIIFSGMSNVNHSIKTKSEFHCCECSGKVNQLSEELSLRNMRIKSLWNAVEELRDQVETEKYESYRWWLAHDKLRIQLESAKYDRVWKSMRLLHVICCFCNKVLKVAKCCLRPLYRVIKPIVGRFPFIYKKLRTLSMSEIMGGLQSVFFDNDGREHTAIYLDKRAVRVLMDLRQEKSRK